MLVITINDMGRNRYSYALAQNGKVLSYGRDAGLRSSSSSKSGYLSMTYANVRYVILAPQEVLEFIPMKLSMEINMTRDQLHTIGRTIRLNVADRTSS